MDTHPYLVELAQAGSVSLRAGLVNVPSHERDFLEAWWRVLSPSSTIVLSTDTLLNQPRNIDKLLAEYDSCPISDNHTRSFADTIFLNGNDLAAYQRGIYKRLCLDSKRLVSHVTWAERRMQRAINGAITATDALLQDEPSSIHSGLEFIHNSDSPSSSIPLEAVLYELELIIEECKTGGRPISEIFDRPPTPLSFRTITSSSGTISSISTRPHSIFFQPHTANTGLSPMQQLIIQGPLQLGGAQTKNIGRARAGSFAVRGVV